MGISPKTVGCNQRPRESLMAECQSGCAAAGIVVAGEGDIIEVFFGTGFVGVVVAGNILAFALTLAHANFVILESE